MVGSCWKCSRWGRRKEARTWVQWPPLTMRHLAHFAGVSSTTTPHPLLILSPAHWVFGTRPGSEKHKRFCARLIEPPTILDELRRQAVSSNQKSIFFVFSMDYPSTYFLSGPFLHDRHIFSSSKSNSKSRGNRQPLLRIFRSWIPFSNSSFRRISFVNKVRTYLWFDCFRVIPADSVYLHFSLFILGKVG